MKHKGVESAPQTGGNIPNEIQQVGKDEGNTSPNEGNANLNLLSDGQKQGWWGRRRQQRKTYRRRRTTEGIRGNNR